MRKFIFSILLFSHLISFAQVQLEGKLISAKSKLNLSSEILIEIIGNGKFALTDINGSFIINNLEKDKEYTLKISSFDFGTYMRTFKTENDTVVKKVLEIDINCEFDSETAKADWKNKNTKLYLIGSIAPKANSKEDLLFEKKYNVTYFDFGCTSAPIQCIIEYNKEVLKLLETEYGEKWKSKIRKDVVVD